MFIQFILSLRRVFESRLWVRCFITSLGIGDCSKAARMLSSSFPVCVSLPRIWTLCSQSSLYLWKISCCCAMEGLEVGKGIGLWCFDSCSWGGSVVGAGSCSVSPLRSRVLTQLSAFGRPKMSPGNGWLLQTSCQLYLWLYTKTTAQLEAWECVISNGFAV